MMRNFIVLFAICTGLSWSAYASNGTATVSVNSGQRGGGITYVSNDNKTDKKGVVGAVERAKKEAADKERARIREEMKNREKNNGSNGSSNSNGSNGSTNSGSNGSNGSNNSGTTGTTCN